VNLQAEVSGTMDRRPWFLGFEHLEESAVPQTIGPPKQFPRIAEKPSPNNTPKSMSRGLRLRRSNNDRLRVQLTPIAYRRSRPEARRRYDDMTTLRGRFGRQTSSTASVARFQLSLRRGCPWWWGDCRRSRHRSIGA